MTTTYSQAAHTAHSQWLLLLYVCLIFTSSGAIAKSTSPLSGRQIMDEVYKRHEQFPYVYEEQIMILLDKAGNRDTRKLRRYSRMDDDNKISYLLLFDDPPEVRGVGLLTTRRGEGNTDTSMYLPAYGAELISSVGQNESTNFLGTDFSVRDLMPEILDDFRYIRQDNEVFSKVKYYVLDVYENSPESKLLLRRHYIDQTNFYITRTDIFDRNGRLHKQKTQHDLKFLGGAMWRANMIRMVDFKMQHESLIKISRRIFSRDYVPENLFTLKWLVANQSMTIPASAEEASTDDDKTDADRNVRKNVSYTISGQP